jgi:U5 snRNP protein, DIM1 family
MQPGLPSLPSATWVDETLISDHDRIVAIRFGRSADPVCRVYDAELSDAVTLLGAHLRAYTVDIDAVPDFTAMYELYDPCTIMCFFRSRPVRCRPC